MKPHEIIELVVLSVCRHYRVSWQKALKKGTAKGSPKALAKKTIYHLIYIFIDEHAVVDMFKCNKQTILNSTAHFNENIRELLPIQSHILKTITIRNYK